jgi:hypothetical protein
MVAFMVDVLMRLHVLRNCLVGESQWNLGGTQSTSSKLEWSFLGLVDSLWIVYQWFEKQSPNHTLENSIDSGRNWICCRIICFMDFVNESFTFLLTTFASDFLQQLIAELKLWHGIDAEKELREWVESLNEIDRLMYEAGYETEIKNNQVQNSSSSSEEAQTENKMDD